MRILKTLSFALALACLSLGVSHASVLDDAAVRDKSSFIKYRFNDVTVSTSAIVYDQSDTTNFPPHLATDHPVLISVRVAVDKVAASTGTFKLGVVTRADATNGDIEWFYSLDFDRDIVGTSIRDFMPLSPGGTRVYVSADNVTPYLFSSEKTMASTVYQTDVPLNTLTGTSVAPGRGDIVGRFDVVGNGTTTALDIVVEIYYYTER